MSQLGSLCSTLRSMIAKHEGKEVAVVETFYESVLDQEWDTEDTIFMLEQAKGISGNADAVLELFINKEKSFT